MPLTRKTKEGRTHKNILKVFRAICSELIRFEERDDLVFEYCACVALAVHLTKGQEGVWGYLTGPPSGGKTEVLRLLMDWKEQVICADDLTKNSMMSAYDVQGVRAAARKDGEKDPYDPSLLPKLNRKTLIIKDLTGMLVREDNCETLMGVLRCAYDQSYSKWSGTLGKQVAKPEFSVLAAVTDDGTDRLMSGDQTLGERFVNLRCQQGVASDSENLSLGLHVLNMRQGGKAKKRRELANACIDLLTAGIEEVKRGPCLAEHPKMARRHDWLIRACSLVTKLRTQAGELTVVSHERNPRLLQVMAGIMDTHSRLSGYSYWTNRAVRLTKRILWDSLPVLNFLMLEYLIACERLGKAVGGIEAHRISRVCGFRHDQVLRQLEEWHHIGIIKQIRRGRIRLRQAILEQLQQVGLPVEPPQCLERVRRSNMQ